MPALTPDDLHRAAQRFGSPLYVYELDEVRARADELMASLPSGSSLYYSLKANPLRAIGTELAAAGCRAEVSSIGELEAALDAGFNASDILYTGPGKGPVELERAVCAGVTLSCESETELRRLSELSRVRRAEVAAVLRLQPAGPVRASLSMGDDHQFGFRMRDALAALRQPRRGVDLRGFHVYVGSQMPSVEAVVEAVGTAKAAVDEAAAAASFPVEVADLGGGFPWPYAVAGRGCGLESLRDALEAILVPWLVEPAGLQFESGRRLVASAGRLLTRVVDRKARGAETVLVVDAGTHVLGGMAGLGRVLRTTIGIENLSRPASEDPPGTVVRVVGPLCTPLDRMSCGGGLHSARVGDLLCVPNVGAYGLTASLTAFLSRPLPVEAVFDGGALVGAWQLRHDHQRLATAREPAVV